MANPKTCEVCGNEFDGRKKHCPHCEELKSSEAESKIVTEVNDLISKTEALNEESSPQQRPAMEASVMLELARSMQSMATSMQSMVGELTLTLKEARLARDEAKVKTPIVQDPRQEPGYQDAKKQDGACHCCGGKDGGHRQRPSQRPPGEEFDDLWEVHDDGIQIKEFLMTLGFKIADKKVVSPCQKVK